MKKLVAVTVLFFTAGLVSAQTEFLADRHGAYGAACAGCHEEEAPGEGAWVEGARCFDCHESYEGLGEKLSYRGEYNPHKSHLGEPDCTICHTGHSEPSVYCAKCHGNVVDAKMK